LSDPFIGEIRAFGFNFAPVGWLPCNGQLLPIQQYQPLFALLGTQFGGNGSSNFGLPNLQGRLILGSSPTHPVGETAGAETVTLTVDQIPAHTHGVTLSGVTATLNGSESGADQNGPTGNALGANPDTAIYTGSAPNKAMAAGSIAFSGNATCAPAGGNQPHPNMPPYLSMNYCIATEGIFPSRS
jgi:microcystin-dependent protein